MRRLLSSPIVRILGGFVLATIVLACLGWFVTGPLRQYPAIFDSAVRSALRQMQSPMWTSLFLAVTKLGSTVYLVIIGSAAGLVFLFLRWFRSVFLLILVMTGQAALHHGFKWLIARPRPAALISYREVESYSFPSGHAVAGLCLYGMIAWIVASRLENSAAKAGVMLASAITISLIGMSRIYIGIHHPTDVLAGFLGGMIWLAAVISIDRRTL